MNLPLHRRCSIVLNDNLQPGLAANAAAVLAASIGRAYPEIVGPAVLDGAGNVHPGITRIPLPILQTDAESLRRLAVSARQGGVEVFGFTDVAQTCHRYEEYTARMASAEPGRLTYAGLALFGPVTDVRRLTGDLALYR